MATNASPIKTRFNAHQPCPVCESGTKDCSATEGGLIFCRGVRDVKAGGKVNGYACVKAEAGAEFFTFKADDPDNPFRQKSTTFHRARADGTNGDGRHGDPPPVIDWTERHRKARERMAPERMGALAATLGISQAALATLEPGFEFNGPDLRGVYTFPMVDGSGGLCGLHTRDAETGQKKAVHGSKLGAIVRAGWREMEGPVYVPEGPSDVAALAAMGLCAVGRPSAQAGLQQLSDLLAGTGREVVVLGELDPKPTGLWPGKDGAVATAKRLALAFRESVSWSLPPDGAKDVRAWFRGQGLSETSLMDECLLAGERFAAGLSLNAVKPPEGGEDDAELIQSAEDIPTLTDARAAGATKKWLWPGWIQADLVNGLLGNFGDGKTRLIAEFVRRVRAGEPWPDGQPMTLPRDSKFLFVPLDYQHSELIDLAEHYGFPEDCIFVNAAKENADGVSYFDTAAGAKALERRVEILRPAFVVIDPITAATADRTRSMGRAEDVTAMYSPLQRIARKYGTAFIISVHTNAQGGTYGRHGTGKFRTEMKLTKVEQEGSERFRLEVNKTNSKKPDALGATQHDGRWDFDDHPPEIDPDAPKGRRGPKPTVDAKAAQWLREQLAGGERLQVELVEAWQKAGHGKKTVFKTAQQMEEGGELLSGEQLSPKGRLMLKTWRLAQKPAAEEEIGD
jgi:hypothetical protein